MLLGANMLFTEKKGGLPYDYEVEWLQGDGTAYVDTGISFAGRNDTTIKFDCNVDFAVGEGDLSSSTTPVFLFGRSSTYRYGVFLNITSGSLVARARIGASSGANSTIEYDRFYKASFQVNYGENVCSIEDNVVSKSATNTTNLSDANGAVNLFCISQTNKICAKTKIKSFDMNAYELGSVDFIPVVKDGIGYFYDKISGKLFGNSAGSGALIIGPKKELPYDYEVEWIQSDGVAYVDTGIETGGKVGAENEFDISVEAYISDSIQSSSGDWITSNGPVVASCVQIGFYSEVIRAYAGRGTVTYEAPEVGKVYAIRIYKSATENVGHAICNGVTKDTSKITSTSVWPTKEMAVFQGRYGSTAFGSSVSRIKTFKAEFNGQRIDFIPVVKNGVACFYDRASGQLFGNSAKDSSGNPVGALIMGPRKS